MMTVTTTTTSQRRGDQRRGGTLCEHVRDQVPRRGVGKRFRRKHRLSYLFRELNACVSGVWRDPRACEMSPRAPRGCARARARAVQNLPLCGAYPGYCGSFINKLPLPKKKGAARARARAVYRQSPWPCVAPCCRVCTHTARDTLILSTYDGSRFIAPGTV